MWIKGIYEIAIYAIAKNEAKFVKRFCESAKDADLMLIADEIKRQYENLYEIMKFATSGQPRVP